MNSPNSLAGNPTRPVRNGSTPEGRGRRTTLRVRVACLRCQRRKIRCNGAVPSCGACLKVGVNCVDGGKQDGIETTRLYISSLRSRVQWLESIIRTNCPDIDLAQGPRVLNDSSENEAVVEREIATDHLPSAPQSGVQIQVDRSISLEPDPSTAGRNVHAVSEIPLGSASQQTGLAHEIGLVSSSAGTDPKYIGPSSGYFFAKLLLACARQGKRGSPPEELQQTVNNRYSRLFPQGFLSIPPIPLPESMDYAIEISEAYFETIHLQYPFLHQPSHMKLIEHVYAEAEPSPIATFQVYLVLAVGATVLSRRMKIPLAGEGFCASAMKYFDKFCIENSLKGLQSLLLLLVYTLNSPSTGLNMWYLNYQCIAALLDLGLQRDVRSGSTMSVLEQELRTRTFWVIYSLDRSVATMLGRPIGLRDEACELRLPADVEDTKLTATDIQPRSDNEQPTHMSSAIHLFKLAQLNSEIKYILHSISHEAPPYTYPNIPDVLHWQRGLVTRLKVWLEQIPQFSGERAHITQLCEIKYHGVTMLLLRPSPAIPSPTIESLKICYESAVASIRLYDQLYKRDLLVYTWDTVHSIFLSTVTMLHCVWTVPEVSAIVKLDMLMADLKAGSNVLSATGEHWSGAKRSRDILGKLSETTVRWIMDSKVRNTDVRPRTRNGRRSGASSARAGMAPPADSFVQHTDSQPLENYGQNPEIEFNQQQEFDLFQGNQQFGSDFYTSLFEDVNMTDPIDFTNPVTVNAIMNGLFTDFQPIYDLGQDFRMDQIMGGQP